MDSKEKKSEYNRRYRLTHLDQIKERNRRWQIVNNEHKNAKNREWYYKNRESQLAKMRVSYQIHKEERRGYNRIASMLRYASLAKSVRETKIGKKCFKCKLICTKDNCDGFDYHHTDPSTKKDSVQHLVKDKYSWKVIECEIKKCELICRVCHAVMNNKGKIRLQVKK